MIGILGGTGLGEALGALGAGQIHTIDTPFGMPSGPIRTTTVSGVDVALLARHGEGHLLHPSTVPFRANIFALKKLGVKHILASAAVGSLRDAMAPRDLVVPDQVIDKTYRRAGTFFDELAVHVEMANPFCPFLRRLLGEAANGLPVKVHTHATYVCMEGPQFSTRAESEMHRAWGGDLIGMTLMPEAKLAREAEICYAAVALVTDYDCWREREESEDKMRLLDEILANVKVATQNALNLVHRAIPHVASQGGRACACQSALELAIWSDRARITPELRARLAPITGKYLP